PTQISLPRIEEVLINGTRLPSRYHAITSSQINGNVAIYDSVRFFNVIPPQLMQDLQANNLSDALIYGSGVTPGDGLADSNDDFYIRGFPRHALYIDGFRLQNTTGTKILPVLIERPEIIKGPSTLYYGQSEPGGVVNIVRKKPRNEAHQRITLTGGSKQEQDLHLDINLPNADQSLAYRLIYANESREQSRDVNNVKRELISSALRLQPNPRSTLDLRYDYQVSSHQRRLNVFSSEQEAILPLQHLPYDDSNTGGTPDFESRYQLASINYSHYFDSDWLIQAGYFHQREHSEGFRGLSSNFLSGNALASALELYHTLLSDNLRLFFLEPSADASTSTETFNPSVIIDAFPDEDSKLNVDFINFSIEGSPTLFNLPNHVKVGFDWYRSDSDTSLSLARLIKSTDNYQGLQQDFLERLRNINGFKLQKSRLNFDEYGLYLQDNIELSESLRISIGGRYLQTNGNNTLNIEFADQPENQNKPTQNNLATIKEFSSLLGFSYQPKGNYSLFFNYSESVKTNYDINNLTTDATPELSDQIELGLRLRLFESKLMSTVSVFEINKENVFRRSFFGRNENISGKRKVLGLEWDFTYQVNRHLDIIGRTSFLDAEIIASDEQAIVTDSNNGNLPALASPKMGSAFMHYRFDQAAEHGLSLSLGAYYIGKRFVDDINNTTRISASSPKSLPAYTIVDFSADYQFYLNKYKNTLRFKLSNIADNAYDYASEGLIRRYQGQGRQVLISLEVAL
ncbi:MAG: hypothetical protein COA42_11010, partial [Alteromonadaceae bacterium]